MEDTQASLLDVRIEGQGEMLKPLKETEDELSATHFACPT